MNEKSICVFCGGEAEVESISGQDAYQIECPCGKYISSEFVELEFRERDEEDKKAVSDFIRRSHEMSEVPKINILHGTGELERIIESYITE
jgi:hypothetical protein